MVGSVGTGSNSGVPAQTDVVGFSSFLEELSLSPDGSTQTSTKPQTDDGDTTLIGPAPPSDRTLTTGDNVTEQRVGIDEVDGPVGFDAGGPPTGSSGSLASGNSGSVLPGSTTSDATGTANAGLTSSIGGATQVAATSPIASSPVTGVLNKLAAAGVIGASLGPKAGVFQGVGVFVLSKFDSLENTKFFLTVPPAIGAAASTGYAVMVSIWNRLNPDKQLPLDFAVAGALGATYLRLNLVMTLNGGALQRLAESNWNPNVLTASDVEFGLGAVVPFGPAGGQVGAAFYNFRITPDLITSIRSGSWNGTLSGNAGVIGNIAGLVGAAGTALKIPQAGAAFATQQNGSAYAGLAWRASVSFNNGNLGPVIVGGQTFDPAKAWRDTVAPRSTVVNGKTVYFARLPVLNLGNPATARENIQTHLVYGANIWSVANSTNGQNFGVGAVEVANRFLAFARSKNQLPAYAAGQKLQINGQSLANYQMARIIKNELAAADTPAKKQAIIDQLANRYGIDLGIPELRQANAKLMATANAGSIPTDYTFTRQVFQGSYARSNGLIISQLGNNSGVVVADNGNFNNRNNLVAASAGAGVSALDFSAQSSPTGVASLTPDTTDVDDDTSNLELEEVELFDPTIEDPAISPWDSTLGGALLTAITKFREPTQDEIDSGANFDYLANPSFKTELSAADKSAIQAAVTAIFALPGGQAPTPEKFAKLIEDMRNQYAAGTPEDAIVEQAIAAAAIASPNGLAAFSKVQLDRAIKQLADAGETALTANQKDVFRVEFRKLMRDEAMLTQPAFDEALSRAKAAPANAPPFQPLPPGSDLPPPDPSRGSVSTKTWDNGYTANNYYLIVGGPITGLRALGPGEVYVSNTRTTYIERTYADGSVERWTRQVSDISIRVLGTSRFNEYLRNAPGPDNAITKTFVYRTM